MCHYELSVAVGKRKNTVTEAYTVSLSEYQQQVNL